MPNRDGTGPTGNGPQGGGRGGCPQNGVDRDKQKQQPQGPGAGQGPGKGQGQGQGRGRGGGRGQGGWRQPLSAGPRSSPGQTTRRRPVAGGRPFMEQQP